MEGISKCALLLSFVLLSTIYRVKTGCPKERFHMPMNEISDGYIVGNPALQIHGNVEVSSSLTGNGALLDESGAWLSTDFDNMACVGSPLHCPNGFTLSFWFQRRSPKTDAILITNYDNLATSRGFRFEYQGDKVKWTLLSADDGKWSFSTTAPPILDWRHVTFVWDTVKTSVYVYANLWGVFQRESGGHGVVVTDDFTSLVVGRDPSTGSNDPNFMIDDVRFAEELLQQADIYLLAHLYDESNMKFFHWTMDSLSADNKTVEGYTPDVNIGIATRLYQEDIVPGVVDEAVELDGKIQRIVLKPGDDGCIEDMMYCDSGMTVAVWVYPSINASSKDTDMYILSRGGHRCSSNGFYFRLNANSSTGPQNIFEVGVTVETDKWSFVFAMETNKWSHVAFTWSIMTGLKVYIDGGCVGTDTEGTPRPYWEPAEETEPYPDFYVGQANDRFAPTYGMFKVDDLMFWDDLIDIESITSIYYEGYIDSHYIGCYSEDMDSPEFSVLPTYIQAITPATCRYSCRFDNYLFASLRNGNQCFCGNDVGSNTQLTDSECDIQCLNDTSTFCGGSDKNAVFDTSHFMYVQESQTATEAVTGVTLSADLIYKANSISATVTKTSGDAVLYYYDFGDSSGVLEWRFPTIEYQYAESGNYTLTVMVKNQINNESAVYEIAVVIAIRGLRLSLDTAGYAENVTGGVDMEMTFQMKVSFGSKITFEFDFGDGAIESDYKSKGKEYTVTHTYTDIGEYTLTGTAENLVGFEGLTRTVIIIYPVKGLEFTQFNDTLRSPDDAFFLLGLQAGIHPPDDMTLEVDFGDDSSIFTVSNAQISTETPILLSHRYNTAGTYTVFVNCFNLVNSMVFTAEMPVVNLVDAVIVSTSTTLADIGNCTDINATVINGTHITVQIDFGDGENAYTSLMVAGVVIFTHCWEVTGSFIPNVTAHNVYSSITSALADPIIVQEDAYHLVLNSDSPVIIDEDLVTATFQLDALPGFGPPSVPSLEWNFGDGTSLQAEEIALEETNIFLHNYTSIGTYYVILNVWNLVSSARYSTVVEIYEDVRIIGLIVGFWPTNDSHQMAYGPFKNHVPLSNVTQFTANVFSGSNLTYSWQFGDGTIGSGNTTSHIYANAGTYTVRLVVENAVNSQTKQRTVYLIEPIPETLQLTATNYEPMVNEVVNFTVNLGNSYLHACTVWDFHDGSAKLVVGPYYCMQRSDYSSYDKQDGYGNQLQCQHSFGRGGMQMVTVIADNYLSNPSVSVMINVDGLPCNAPIVKIKDSGETFQNPRTEKRSKTVVIRSLVTLDCMTTSLTNFSWSLYRTDNFGNEINLSAQDNGTELVIPAKSQPLGFYKIILTVSMLGVYNTDTESTSYLQLIATPLTVRIVGGSGRPVGYGTVLNLDALTLTFDPDAESPDDKSDLEFMWFCRQSVEDFPMTGNYLDETLPTHEPGVDNGGCFGHGSGRIDYHDGVIRIDTELMDSNTTYVFKVIVMEKDRRGEFDQEIKLVDGIPPVIDISCKTNCGGKVNPTGTLSYQGECTNCLNGVKLSYQWSLYVRNETDGNYNNVHNFQDYTSTGIEKTGISFFPNSLQAGRKYRLGLYGSRQGYVTGYSFLYFTTNLPPFDGVCQISPTTGTAIQTEYIVSCENWVDEGDDVVRSEGSLKSDHLNYRILYGKKDESMSQIYHGSDPSENNLIFAAGPADSDYRYDVIVHIIDNHGAYAEYELSVQVTEMEISPSDSDLLVEQLVTGENSKLEQLMQAGDFQGATQLIMALMSLYPDDGQSDNSTVSGDESDSNEESKGELRSHLLVSLSKVCLWANTIDALLMSSAALADLTGPGATADDALVQAALAMVFMANQLQNIEDQSREEMLNTATSLVEGIGNIIKSAVVVDEKEIEPIPTEPPEFPNFYGDDPSPEEIEEYEAQQALIKQQKVDYAEKAARLISTLGMSIINVVSITVRSTQVVGEPSLLLPSEFLTIELHRDEPEGFQRKEILGTVGSFQLPTAEALFKDSIADTYVDVETTSFAGNPYSWDPTRSKVKSGVIGLNFIDSDGNMMDISGLEESVGFLLDNDPTLLPQWDTVLLDFSQPEDLYRHNFEVKNKDNTVQIVILPTTEIPLKLYIKFNEPPSFQDHLFSCDLPRHVNNSNNLWEDLTGELKYSCQVPPEKLLHTGKYYIGVKIPDNIREITGTGFANYSMMVFSSSCLFWHENEERWSDEGCKVGDLTTTQATHCLCSHLTSFASDFFVPPNSIDFSTVFNKFDLRENSAVFATVFALLGVYFILLIWARRKDKKDIEKWGVTPLADNNPSDKYFYEIAVYTGMRRGAGTRSKVSFMLSGDDEDTGIRNLDDNKRKLFQTGSIDHFVMAVSSSLGPLAYLRIWHDDSGKGQHGSWYLSRIMITDLQTGEIFYFLCDKWLAVEYDDGLIDRVLPVAGREDLTNFNQLFYHTARKNLSEKHLWFSVLSRPSKSHFTRVQRLTCCLSLLYCSMIASAMWFRSEVRAKNVFSVTIGPFTLTSFELYVGVMTNLVVFPINFIIVEIFRRSRPGTISLSKWINRRKTRPESAKFDILFNDTEEKQQTSKKTKKKKTLPHWCLYLGWFICILTVVTSAFFVILYSMEWGADKSEQWLVSIILSFSLSVLVTQPVQVIMIAIFFSCFMKKVTDDDDETGKTSVKANGLKHDEEYLHGPNNDNADRKGKAYVLPPKGDKLEALRKERLNEIQMQSVIREIALYGVFVIVLLSLCYTNRDPNSYVMTNSIHQIFFETEHKMARIKFDGLSRTSPDIFWDWMEESMIPGLYSEKYYNGDEMHWRHKRFIKNRESYRVGPARLRQLRVPPVNCDIEDPMDSVIFNCTTDYKIYSNEETRHFDIGWTSLNLTGVNLTSFTSEVNSPWIYHTASELNGLPVLGHQTLYGGGGYIATLETTMEKSHELVSYLRNNSWYDKFTRAIFVELTVYNANVNLFSLVTFLIELPTLGGGLLSPTISTFRLYNYVGLAAIFVILAQVVYVFFVAYFLIHELLKIRKEKKKYFKSFWNCLELVLVVFAITVIAMYVFRQIFTTLALKDVREDHFKFVNFQHLAYWDTIFTWILAITLFIAVLKFLKLLRFNKRMSMLGMTLKNCFRDLLYFSVIWIIVFLAYCQVFYLVFGTSLMDYASMSVTMATQISMMLGRFDYHALNEINRVFSKIFFFFFILCLYWILMNMFLTILNQSIHAVKNDISRQSNEYEIVEFIWRRFVQFIGVSGNRGPTVTRHKIPKVKIQGPDSPKEGATSNSDFSEEAFIRSIDRLVGYVLRHYGDIDVVQQNEGKEWTMAISLKNGKSNKKTKKALTTS